MDKSHIQCIINQMSLSLLLRFAILELEARYIRKGTICLLSTPWNLMIYLYLSRLTADRHSADREG